MLIDNTYFFGDCSIGQLSEDSVQGKLSWLIQQYEPEYLLGILGYQTMTDFLAGILVSPMDPIWSGLLTGSEYTDINGRQRRWRGLTNMPQGSSFVNFNNQIVVTVGGPGAYDPPVGMTATIPPGLVGTNFVFEYRAFGPLILGTDYTVSGNQLTLLSPMAFRITDKYFYFGTSTTAVNNPNFQTTSLSPIAYYVYYQYQKSQATNTAGTGEVVLDAENSIMATPAQKMVTAWNKMVHINRELFDFLYVNQKDYPDWLMSVYQGYGLFGSYRTDNARKFLTTINTFGF